MSGKWRRAALARLALRHKDHDPHNNEPDNLEVVELDHMDGPALELIEREVRPGANHRHRYYIRERG